METCVVFKSRLFEPFLSEDAQVNPQCYGAELAWWLSRELAKRGVETSYPNYEDWGWFIEYVVGENEYWLCCGNVNRERISWKVCLDSKAKGMFGRKKAPVEAAAPLLQSLKSVLAESEGISEILWSKENV